MKATIALLVIFLCSTTLVLADDTQASELATSLGFTAPRQMNGYFEEVHNSLFKIDFLHGQVRLIDGQLRNEEDPKKKISSRGNAAGRSKNSTTGRRRRGWYGNGNLHKSPTS